MVQTGLIIQDKTKTKNVQVRRVHAVMLHAYCTSVVCNAESEN